MSEDLAALWAERDRAQEAWRLFTEEARQYEVREDPVLVALSVPPQFRTTEHLQTINEFTKRRGDLLKAVLEAERRIRVATGHEKIKHL